MTKKSIDDLIEEYKDLIKETEFEMMKNIRSLEKEKKFQSFLKLMSIHLASVASTHIMTFPEEFDDILANSLTTFYKKSLEDTRNRQQEKQNE